MKSWAKALKQWWLWLVGDSPLPGRRARVLLAGTAVLVVVLLVGISVAVRSPAKTAAASSDGHHGSSGHKSSQPSHGSSTSSTKSFKSLFYPYRSNRVLNQTTTTTTTTTPDSSKVVRGHATRSGTRRGSHTHGATTTTTAPKAAAAVALPASGDLGLPTDPAGALVGTPGESAALDPAVTPSVPLPPTPVAVGATSGHGRSRVSWIANPKNADTTGYNVYVGESPGEESTIPVNGASLISGKSFDVTGLDNGTTYYFVVRAVGPGGVSAPSAELMATPGNGYRSSGALASPVVSVASMPEGGGYWEVNAQGAVTAHGGAANDGSSDDLTLAAPVQQIVPTPDGKGYWLVAADGGVFAFGDAGYYGSMAGQSMDAPVVGLASTADGQGYWEVSSDGGVFAFGDAKFDGSMGGQPLAAPVVGMTADPAGGYWLVGKDGGVYAFDAPFLGSAAGTATHPVVGVASTANGQGYWEVSTDGGVFAYGMAAFYGSASNLYLAAPVTGITSDPVSAGYWLVAGDGGIFSYGAPFFGAD